MSKAKKIAAPDDTQFKLFGGMPDGANGRLLKTAVNSGRRFITGDASAIYLGTTRLEDYLKQAGQVAAFTVARLLDEQNWLPFEARYAPTGRAPYAPRLMLGLILYGVMQGIHSLRELEQMARLDLGCMWVTGGIAPDHANIGRFIVLHEESLTNEFFESLTRSILKASNSKSARLAGDGTVIEAACSYYNLLKSEAVKARAEAADTKLTNNPDDPAAQQEKQASAQCLAIFEERQQARRRSGRDPETLRISGTEPEAMVQRLKRGKGSAASYKPSVLANEERIVIALALDPSNETKVVGEMLDQSARVIGAHTEEVLLDAGYFDDGVIAATLERGVSMLCPDGQTPGVPKQGKVFPKSTFVYDSSTDTYRCPAGQILILLKRRDATEKTRAYGMYGGATCGDCPSREQCTRATERLIERYPEDTQRDALRQVMQQQQARAAFGKRKAMVEPVFSHLRGQQGLSRFRRTGLKAVKREFALHVMAYNLSRAVALLRAFSGLFIALNLSLDVLRTFFHPLRKFRSDARIEGEAILVLI
jgi:transposase